MRDAEASITIDDVKIGEIVIVRAGERIPVDGTVASGNASVNQAPITGESVPVEKRTDDQVFAGTVVDLGALDVRVNKRGKETLYSRIITLVENAQASSSAGSEAYRPRGRVAYSGRVDFFSSSNTSPSPATWNLPSLP